ncbi:MAG: OmpA family protein [Chlamydiota bacterium]|nr:OmpA family protein [Chlamydiota bacterium]
MKKSRLFLLFNFLCAILTLTSCSRSGTKVWDDTKSCGRHVKRGLCSLGGKQGDSREVRCREDFMCQNDGYYGYGSGDEFIPLSDIDSDDQIAMVDFAARQPKETPGDPGSTIPGIEAFRDPSTMSSESEIFKNIKYPFDSSLIKGQENLAIVASVAAYMKKNTNTYVFVEGHADERGAEAYNLALGARRANALRNALVKEGVNPDHIFTISYGKERPLVFGHNEDAWSQNRRSEFKVYHR